MGRVSDDTKGRRNDFTLKDLTFFVRGKVREIKKKNYKVFCAECPLGNGRTYGRL